MSSNLDPFDHPDCACERWLDAAGVTAGVQVSDSCPIHGIGTDYWNRMTEERNRLANGVWMTPNDWRQMHGQ